MDQAIYESTTNTIFGVKGQWLHQFSATTGALIQSMRFTTNVMGTSTIAAVSGTLYIGVSWTPVVNYTLASPYPDEDIYVVDAATFTLTGRLNLGSHITAPPSSAFHGWRYIAAGGDGLIGYYLDNTGQSFFNYNIGTAAFTHVGQQGVTDVCWDATNGVIWAPSSFDPDLYCYDPNFASFNKAFDTNGNLNTICGVTYNQANNRVYAVDGTAAFYNFNASLAVPGFTNFLVNTLATGRINCNAFRIKSVNGYAGNAYNGKVLIAGWADDSVIIITPNALDPTLDTVAVQTGFTAPIDIVVCPTVNFAMQSGVTGLKQIT